MVFLTVSQTDWFSGSSSSSLRGLTHSLAEDLGNSSSRIKAIARMHGTHLMDWAGIPLSVLMAIVERNSGININKLYGQRERKTY